MKYLFSLIILFSFRPGAFAQVTYAISGTVTDTTGAKIQSATVFIAGSEKATATDENGNFVFRNMLPGNYQLVVNMLGYNYVKQAVVLNDRTETIKITLGEKKEELHEVVIGSKKILPKPWQLRLFKKTFIGDTGFAKNCKLVNPEILRFKEVGLTLWAKTNDFLIVENNSLGYRIKYLLKNFHYTPGKGSYFYDGDFSFEAMSGTPEQQTIWETNRRIAYQGSFMHYLRSVHTQNAEKEGFLTYQIIDMDFPVMDMAVDAVNPERIVSRIEGDQALFQFGTMWYYVIYNPQNKAQKFRPLGKDYVRLYSPDPMGSAFRISGQFDSRGSLNAFNSIEIKAYWASKRLAYQLPYEYVYTLNDTNK